eukprot:c9608_g1_i1.p2 GENE.c9608_g1_i1~~c9608_g1_i1.p2  ORF type:complete len:566 (-),score=162.60 c9608_g1_i1:1917-3374(-)
MGAPQQPGVIIRTVEMLLGEISHVTDRAITLSIQCVEIYNENVRDLIGEGIAALDIRETVSEGTFVVGCAEEKVTSVSELLTLLQNANKRRTTEATNMNETSSRSHAIVTVILDSKVNRSKLSLIDLAGSEKAKKTQATGQRLLEGSNINKSLLALGNCISALGGKGKQGGFVNFRDSKLTRLLKDSLGGNTRTSMIGTLSAISSCFDETLSTLKYANRAKNIKTVAQVNFTSPQSKLIANYRRTIDELRTTIQSLQEALLEKRMKIAGIQTISMRPNNLTPPRAQLTAEQMDVQNEITRNFSTRNQLRKSLHVISGTLSSFAFQHAMTVAELRKIEDNVNDRAIAVPSPQQIDDVRRRLGDLQEKINEIHRNGVKAHYALKDNEESATNVLEKISSLEVTENFQPFVDAVQNSCFIEREVMQMELESQIREKIVEEIFSVLLQHKSSHLIPSSTKALLREYSLVPDSDIMHHLATQDESIEIEI